MCTHVYCVHLYVYLHTYTYICMQVCIYTYIDNAIINTLFTDVNSRCDGQSNQGLVLHDHMLARGHRDQVLNSTCLCDGTNHLLLGSKGEEVNGWRAGVRRTVLLRNWLGCGCVWWEPPAGDWLLPSLRRALWFHTSPWCGSAARCLCPAPGPPPLPVTQTGEQGDTNIFRSMSFKQWIKNQLQTGDVPTHSDFPRTSFLRGQRLCGDPCIPVGTYYQIVYSFWLDCMFFCNEYLPFTNLDWKFKHLWRVESFFKIMHWFELKTCQSLT